MSSSLQAPRKEFGHPIKKCVAGIPSRLERTRVAARAHSNSIREKFA